MKPVRPNRAAAAARPQGAVQSKSRLGDRFDAWMAHHSTTAIDSLLRLLRTPLQSLMTWLVVAIAVALPAVLYIALTNIQNIGYSWQDSSQISVFLNKQVSDSQAEELRRRWANRADIAQVIYVSPTIALEEFKTASGLGNVVDSLDENPLPGVLLVQPGLAGSTPAGLEALEQVLRQDPLVTDVRIDMQWVKRLHQFMAVAQRVVMALAGLLALGVILVIGNTIRLAIENRRDEILVVKLVGGTNAYVRRPFLYTGLWYGLGGGLLALVLLAIGLGWLGGPVAHLADLYQSSFRLQGLGFIHSLQLVLLAGITGLLGAWIAVGRHLSHIEPH
ncbi:permease-like cell division protein FtsX [Cellvibrio sp. ARAG 10.3]|uniref:permease-like cell division protein FtsX n=1 Tax=Cellvibrio sp. ARAG 10.3 TaxID=3451358 RepID=UPI003F465337